ncbi:MAG: anthranilate synthase component I family protein [Candidatus Diapherotrites archaeon]|nr:anthranilate synthase component I family protein [Candidatus Diapherotrites archaeon]
MGGAVGYVSFEFIRQQEKITGTLADDTDFPDFEFGVFNDAVVFNHSENSIHYIHRGENRLEELNGFIQDASFESKPFEMYNKKCSRTPEAFHADVEKAQEHIRAGDIFQTVLSKRYEIRFSGSLLPFYRKLKAISPSPYMYCLQFGERQVIGSSPENLIRVEGNEITSYATLAGTRPRGKTPAQDQMLEEELLSDEKERAEHIMLVDLTRNDVGKVAVPGSVQVSELMTVRKYANVQHISSVVSGKLRAGQNTENAFTAIFPAGTVSGAPKIRAIEIIGETEKIRRGPYGGAVGYFSANGNMDFAICIRSLFAHKNKAFIQTGAGIVADSVPEKEFAETEAKARALLNAIGDEKYENAFNR